MQTVQQAIYQAQVKGKEQIDALAQSLGVVAAREEKVTAATTATERSFERLIGQLNPAIRANQQYQATLERLQRYEEAGIGTAQQRALAIELARRRFQQAGVANDNFGRSAELAGRRSGALGNSLGQLSFQINDVVSGLAMGQKPMQIFAQQGGQIFQIWQMNRNLFTDLKEAIAAMALRLATALGPLGLLSVGLLAAGAAAAAFYELTKKEGPTTEKLLEEHNRLLGVIKDSYDKVTRSAANWNEQSRDVTRLQLVQQQIDIQQKLGQELEKQSRKFLEIDFGNSGGGQFAYRVKEQYKIFEDAIYKLAEGYQKGEPNVRAFNDEVARIAFAFGLASPEIQKLGAEMIASLGDASKFSNALKQIKEAFDLLAGRPLARGNSLGIDIGSQVNAYEQLIQRAKDRNKELEEEAKYAGMASSSVAQLKLQHDAERAAKQAGVKVNQAELDQIKQELALRTKLRDIANVRADIEFSRKTLGLSPEDVQIAERLKSIYGNDVPAALNSTEAAQMRVVNRAREMKDAFQGAAETLVSGLMQGKSVMSSLTGAASQLTQRLASTNLNRFLGGGSLFGNENLMSGQGAMGIGAAGLGGYQSGSPLGGALSGALAGATFGPVGAVVGGLVGLAGGLFGKSDKAEEARKKQIEEAKQAWAGMRLDWQKFLATSDGGMVGALRERQITLQNQLQQYVLVLEKMGDTVTRTQAFVAYYNTINRALFDFAASFKDTITAFSAGGGSQSYFGGINAAKSVIDQAKSFLDDVAYFNAQPGWSGDPAGMMNDARKATQDFVLSVVGVAPDISDVAKRIAELTGAAGEVKRALADMGMTASEAATAVNENLTASMADLAKTFTDGIQSELNSALGQGYLNDLASLIQKVNQQRADAALLGVDTTLIDRYFAVQAQKIVDDAGLVGDAFDDLIVTFPQLVDVVTKAASSILAEYQKSLLIGQYSTLSPAEQLARAKTEFEAAVTRVNAEGSSDNQSALQAASQTYLDQARAFYASGAGYAAAFDAVQQALSAITGLSFAKGGLVPGFAAGGMIGNGIYGVDSVRARYAGGGDVMLAGGEFVNRAASVNAQTMPVLSYINSNGRLPTNDNGVADYGPVLTNLTRVTADGFNNQTSALLEELQALRREVRSLREEQSRNSPRRAPGKTHAA